MKIRFTQIFSYIARDNPTAAAAVTRQIDRTIARLAEFPSMGRPKLKAGIRMLPAGRFRHYLVIYTIEGDEVVILSVRHGARRPPWERG